MPSWAVFHVSRISRIPLRETHSGPGCALASPPHGYVFGPTLERGYSRFRWDPNSRHPNPHILIHDGRPRRHLERMLLDASGHFLGVCLDLAAFLPRVGHLGGLRWVVLENTIHFDADQARLVTAGVE